MADFPIELRRAIVQPAVVYPKQHVGIEVVVVLQACRGTAVLRVGALVAVDAKGRYAHLHPGLARVHRLVELLDKQVDVVAPPVSDVAEAARVSPEVSLVGDSLTVGVGVEVVVDVKSVHIIASHDVVGHTADIVAVLLQSGVEDELACVCERALGMLHGDVAGSHLPGRGYPCAVGVDPRMQLHAALVALLHHPLQRVPVGTWRLPLTACKETAPRLDGAGIQRVALGTYLEDDGVDTVSPKHVQLMGELLLHRRCREPIVLSVDNLHPSPAEFPLLGKCDAGCQQ